MEFINSCTTVQTLLVPFLTAQIHGRDKCTFFQTCSQSHDPRVQAGLVLLLRLNVDCQLGFWQFCSVKSSIFKCVCEFGIPGDSSCAHNLSVYYGIATQVTAGESQVYVSFLVFAVAKKGQIRSSFLLNSHLHSAWEGCGWGITIQLP